MWVVLLIASSAGSLGSPDETAGDGQTHRAVAQFDGGGSGSLTRRAGMGKMRGWPPETPSQ